MKNPADHTSLLDPALLDSVQGLQLISRVLSEELLAGANVSRKTGMGMEFSQYRTYEPGDDLRLLDWKLFARTERYYVRQSVVYSNIHIRFIMDNTASMGYEENGITKLKLGSLLIATLAQLAYQSGDQYSLSLINGAALPMAATRRHLDRVLFNLYNARAEGQWPHELNVSTWTRSLQKECIILVTDLYQEGDEIVSFIDKIKLPQNEVIIFNIIGKREEDLLYKKPVFFKDLESGKLLRTDPSKVKEEYLRKRESYVREIHARMKEKEAPIYDFYLNESPAKDLRKFLTDRTYLHL